MSAYLDGVQSLHDLDPTTADETSQETVMQSESCRRDGLRYGEHGKELTFSNDSLNSTPIEILSTWFGSKEAVVPKLTEHLHKVIPSCFMIGLLPRAECSYHPVRQCYIPLIQHWTRTIPPDILEQAAPQLLMPGILGMLGALVGVSQFSLEAIRITQIPLRVSLVCSPKQS